MIKDEAYSGDSGVSETIGFVVILGIVITGIAMVTLYGYPALIQEQQNTNIKNMQKNMLVLQSDLRSLTAKGVPYQETAIQVSGGTLMTHKTTSRFTIEIDGVLIEEQVPEELRFISQDGSTTIVLENGAVNTRYSSDPTGSAMLAQPSWFYDAPTETYVIHLTRMYGNNLSQTGIGTVKMQLCDPPTTSPPYNIVDKTAKITYHADPGEDFMIAWKNYLGTPDLQMTNPTISGRSITYTLNPSADKLVIKTYNVTIPSL